MSIVFTGSTTASSITTSIVVAPLPGSTGDLLLALFHTDASTNVSVAGWSLAATTTTNGRTSLFHKFKTISDTSATFVYTVVANAVVGISAYSGVNSVPRFDGIGTPFSSGVGSPVTATGVTTTIAGDEIVMFGANVTNEIDVNWSNWTTNNPGVLTERFDSAFDGFPGVASASAQQTSPGATNIGIATLDVSVAWDAILLALRPAVPICVIDETQVLTPSGYIQIKDLKADDFVIDSNGNPVQILYNIKGGFSRQFIRVGKNAIGDQQPNHDLYITAQHPLLINGKEKSCEDLIDNKMIIKLELDHPKQLYSLCTKERIYIIMNGINVCSWSDQEFKDFSNKKNIKYEVQ